MGFLVTEWTTLAGGLRPEPREPEHHEPGAQRAGWQHEAASHPASRQPNATGHVPVAGVPFDPIILPDAVGTCSLPGPSPSPFPSFALD